MKFSRKICLKIILKVTNQGFTISLEDTFFKKPQGVCGGGGGKLTLPAVLGLIILLILLVS